jgi:DnaJ-class molecular chaperone
MTGTVSTAGYETAANTEGSQPANNSGTSENEDIQSYTPDQKKREVLRILKWPSWAHYETLEIAEAASTGEIESAFRRKSLLTHTDQNSDKKAKDVFQSK